MAEARQRAAWDHTASLLALLANIHRGKGQRPRKPEDFHPFPQRRRRKPREKAPFRTLKSVFCKGK